MEITSGVTPVPVHCCLLRTLPEMFIQEFGRRCRFARFGHDGSCLLALRRRCILVALPRSDVWHDTLTPNLDLSVRSLVGVLLAFAGRRSADAFAVGGASRHAIGRRGAFSGAPVVRLPCRRSCRPAHRGAIFCTLSCTARWTWGETSQRWFESCHPALSLAVSSIWSSFLHR